MPKQKKVTFLDGAPEVVIVRLVRRAHSSQNCPHEGNCLSEKEMFRKLHEILLSLQAHAAIERPQKRIPHAERPEKRTER